MMTNSKNLIIMAVVIIAGCARKEQVYEPGSGILTPKPGPEPKINGARIFGVRPGSPVLYTIAATGDRPMEFSAENLPEGAIINKGKGFITGSVLKPGTYPITLKAQNNLGTDEEELRLVVGDEIALTPPMGCNTWGGHGPFVDEKGVRASAEAMVETGLINHGYCYINIDDGWQGKRGGSYNAIQPNDKFDDLGVLCDDLHAMGLKVGIYSTPMKTSYAGFTGGSSDKEDGSWDTEASRSERFQVGKFRFGSNDARQIAGWGFDYFKYDWGIKPDHVELAKEMKDAIVTIGRDIVLDLNNSTPMSKAAEFTGIGTMTRTTGDLVDVWDKSQLDAGKQRWALGVSDVWVEHKEWREFNRPGHWNYPCALRIGYLGVWDQKPLRPTRLTPDEQYAHISLL